MRSKLLIVLMLVCLALTGLALQKQSKPPKARKPPAEKHRKGPWVVILAISDRSTTTEDESNVRKLYARAGLLKFFGDKHIQVVSPAELQAYQDQHPNTDLSSQDNWTSDTFKSVATALQAQYVSAAILNSVEVAVPQGADPKKPARSMTANITARVWLFNTKMKDQPNGVMLMDGNPIRSSYTARKGDEKLDASSIGYQAIINAMQNAYSAGFNSKVK